jgi:hypothetical protein
MKTILFAVPALVALLAASAAQAKCNVTLELKNSNDRQITVLGSDSKAKVNGGTWSKMNFGNITIPAGQTRDASWVTNMSCSGNAKRDLKIEYQESGSNQTYTEHKDDINVEPGVAVQVTLKH